MREGSEVYRELRGVHCSSVQAREIEKSLYESNESQFVHRGSSFNMQFLNGSQRDSES